MRKKLKKFKALITHEFREDAKDKIPSHLAQYQEMPPKDDGEEKDADQNPFQKFRKIGCLVFVWIVMVMFLTSTPEKVLERRQLAVPITGQRIYNFPLLPMGTRINATLSGAFLPSASLADQQQSQKQAGYISPKRVQIAERVNYIKVYLQSDNDSEPLTQPKFFSVAPPQLFDRTNTTKVPIMFDIGEENRERVGFLQLVIESNFTKTRENEKQEMPLIFTYDLSPINRQIGVICAAFVLIFLYALIIWEVSRAVKLRCL